MILPINSARQRAASFPEGSMRANKRSQAERVSPASSCAEVPGVSAIQSGTRKLTSLRSTSYFLAMRMVRQQVIILVTDAIYIQLSARLERRGSRVLRFRQRQVLAVTVLHVPFIKAGLWIEQDTLSQNYCPPGWYHRYPRLYFFTGLSSPGSIWPRDLMWCSGTGDLGSGRNFLSYLTTFLVSTSETELFFTCFVIIRDSTYPSVGVALFQLTHLA